VSAGQRTGLPCGCRADGCRPAGWRPVTRPPGGRQSVAHRCHPSHVMV